MNKSARDPLPRTTPPRSPLPLIGLFITLLLAWLIPMAALRWGIIKHHMWHTRIPWQVPSGINGRVNTSRLPLSDWYIVRPVRTEDSVIPPGTRAHIPSWVASPPAGVPHIFQVDTAGTGWPMRAFASESWTYTDPAANSAVRSHEVLRYNFVLYSGPGGRIILPLRPIWPGLLADIALYSFSALFITLVFTMARSHHRRRRGLCPRCKYDLRATPPGSPCPECGAGPSQSPS